MPAAPLPSLHPRIARAPSSTLLTARTSPAPPRLHHGRHEFALATDKLAYPQQTSPAARQVYPAPAVRCVSSPSRAMRNQPSRGRRTQPQPYERPQPSPAMRVVASTSPAVSTTRRLSRKAAASCASCPLPVAHCPSPFGARCPIAAPSKTHHCRSRRDAPLPLPGHAVPRLWLYGLHRLRLYGLRRLQHMNRPIARDSSCTSLSLNEVYPADA
ncbi:uncharacterized protein SCHCODRAFT_02644154 [Schizophyllum commune H4-8]|nr:uncharacterized protein SCHCODRAFT_02644154 [Schizophyllum commune H4-8]KAI5885709.1 hypothetical protein SCHCODRAFT_02644154 [Schizophyllum commune H4-8]